MSILCAFAAACAGGTSGSPHDDGDAGPEEGGAPPMDAGVDATADLEDSGVERDPRTTTAIIHSEHRAVPGQMFGGWGPHLGHLVRRALASGDELWFADDACAPGTCSVDHDERVDYLRLGEDGWELVASLDLPAGIQQNTASVLSGSVVHTIGVDVGIPALTECAYDLDLGFFHCAVLEVDVGENANYVGAAVSPNGALLAWLTNVGDGGGGSFRHYADYGGGWNGPRISGVGGYNDASYIHAAFGVDGDEDRFAMLGELVSGLAPDWSFTAGLAVGDVATDDSLVWSTPFAPPPGDPAITTNDALVDPRSGDLHLVVRLQSGAAATYFRASGGELEGPIDVLPASPRVRLVALADGSVVLVRAAAGEGLFVTRCTAGDREAGVPIRWSELAEISVPLPAGYEDLYAIYTEAPPYPFSLPLTLDVALVGAAREHEVLHAHVEW
jgi:hypothetical protein